MAGHVLDEREPRRLLAVEPAQQLGEANFVQVMMEQMGD